MNEPFIPTFVPSTLRAGNTWRWTRTAPSDYPATSWTLKYQLKGPERITITATADGDNFSITVAASTTKAYHPGVYEWVSSIEQTSNPDERHELESGRITVGHDFATSAAGFDARSHSQRMVDLLQVGIEGLADKGVVELSIAGRSYRREDLNTLYGMLNLYERRVATELGSRSKKILYQFTTTS